MAVSPEAVFRELTGNTLEYRENVLCLSGLFGLLSETTRERGAHDKVSFDLRYGTDR